MKTQDLLSISEVEFVRATRDMKIKELERHASKLAAKGGCDDFAALLSALIKTLPSFEGDALSRFSQVKHWLTSWCSEKSQADLLDRLATLLIVLISKKFHKIHNERTSLY